MPLPTLDRLAIDDVATNPERIAEEIHRQLGVRRGPVLVDQIAFELGIEEIRKRPLTAFEAALATDPERSSGMILVNEKSAHERRRYSTAHELGHYVCGWHNATTGWFRCTKQDMATENYRLARSLHARQENEANAFAIELLAPEYLIAPYLRGYPDLGKVLAMGQLLEISKVAAARRFAYRHPKPVAVVFSQKGAFLYAHRGGEFPWLKLVKGELLQDTPKVDQTGLSDMIEVDSRDWGISRSTRSPCSICSKRMTLDCIYSR